ncbi:MAG: hypothetical protein ACM33B_11090 [Pseudomonadota bacterium]
MRDDGATTRFCDEEPWGFGWFRKGDRFVRTSHALLADGGVWLVDPLDAPGVEERVRALGEPRGVIQLLDRHARDGAAWAARLGVPHHVVPFAPVGPFELVPLVRSRWWREAALWWPGERVLAIADALGSIPYFRGGDEPLGVHPLLRLRPPWPLLRLAPEHVLVGHGRGVHGPETAAAMRDSIRAARRRLPRAWAGAALSPLRGRRR